MGKGEIARYEQFLLFPQCFPKACFPGASKGVIVWEWVNSLPHDHDIKQPCMRSLLKRLWEKEKMLVNSIFTFSHNVFYFSRKNFNFSVTFIFSSANAFSLYQSYNLLFGKELGNKF